MANLVNETTPVLENHEVGPRLHLMVLEAPEIAKAIRPGQFVHMRIPGMEGHILRRPFSVYAADPARGTIEILYQVVGFGSDRMTKLSPADEVAPELIGPVGASWNVPEGAKRALLVGGGVGAAPLFMLFEQLVHAGVDVTVVLGAQTEAALVCKNRYARVLSSARTCAENAPLCATDDGSYGRAGFCTSLVDDALAQAASDDNPFDYLAVCGPEPLMRIVAGKARDAHVPCEVSLEKRMACGVGACLSCVVETVHGKKRSCVDGPVFPAEEVLW